MQWIEVERLTMLCFLLCHLVKREMRDRLSGAVEAFARKNGSPAALHGDYSRHRTSDNVLSSKDVVSKIQRLFSCTHSLIAIYYLCENPKLFQDSVYTYFVSIYTRADVHLIWGLMMTMYYLFACCFCLLQQVDTERGRVSRTTSASKRAVVSSSRPSSSGEPSENRLNRLGSSSGRLSTTQRAQPGFESKSSSFTTQRIQPGFESKSSSFTTQRIQPGFESKSSSFTRGVASRGGRDDALRSFELLTIGSGKRK